MAEPWNAGEGDWIATAARLRRRAGDATDDAGDSAHLSSFFTTTRSVAQKKCWVLGRIRDCALSRRDSIRKQIAIRDLSDTCGPSPSTRSDGGPVLGPALSSHGKSIVNFAHLRFSTGTAFKRRVAGGVAARSSVLCWHADFAATASESFPGAEFSATTIACRARRGTSLLLIGDGKGGGHLELCGARRVPGIRRHAARLRRLQRRPVLESPSSEPAATKYCCVPRRKARTGVRLRGPSATRTPLAHKCASCRERMARCARLGGRVLVADGAWKVFGSGWALPTAVWAAGLAHEVAHGATAARVTLTFPVTFPRK